MFSKVDRSKVKVAASLLSADFAHLADEVKHVTEAGIDRIHVEVNDGVFSPEITVGAPVVKSLRKTTDAIIEAHLMTVHPERKIESFAKAGADIIIFHIETTHQAEAVIQQIKNAGSKAGIAINPATPIVMLEEILPIADVVLVMTANPGSAGQRLIDSTLKKIKKLHEIIRAENYDCYLEADGGINIETAAAVREAGANILVAGTAIYESTDVLASLSRLTGEE
ncbi:MAG: ribulose-phosphate 3-epimerase [Selenomonadaceae bacterium]|nr:ribulose-phosphate 3-epimerase [Selenomonadaceae bacterium]